MNILIKLIFLSSGPDLFATLIFRTIIYVSSRTHYIHIIMNGCNVHKLHTRARALTALFIHSFYDWPQWDRLRHVIDSRDLRSSIKGGWKNASIKTVFMYSKTDRRRPKKCCTMCVMYFIRNESRPKRRSQTQSLLGPNEQYDNNNIVKGCVNGLGDDCRQMSVRDKLLQHRIIHNIIIMLQRTDV